MKRRIRVAAASSLLALGALGLVTGTIFYVHRRAVRAGRTATARPEPPAEALPDT